MKRNKNSKLLKSFVKYCQKNPDERFWQALRNWSGFKYILRANDSQLEATFKGVEDTFYDR